MNLFECGANGNGGATTARGGENTYRRRGKHFQMGPSPPKKCAILKGQSGFYGKDQNQKQEHLILSYISKEESSQYQGRREHAYRKV